jgi:hypothetical protein
MKKTIHKAIPLLKVLLLISIMVSCNNDDDNLGSGGSSDFNYNQGNSVNRNFFGLILDTSGNPVSNATVSVGSTSVQTNPNGLFTIENVSVKEKFAHIKVSKAGFINGSRVLIPTSGDNRINIMLIPNTPTATVNSGVASEVNLPNGTKVKFDGSFVDASGTAYSGTVQVGLYHIKPSDTYFNETMPGSLLAADENGNAKVLESFGMLHVELTGSSGQKLNLATGHPSEISLDIDSTQLSSSPSSIPLWSFDEVAGIWKEDGQATKIGNKYVGNVSHFSWWNCDAPFNQCNLTVTVNNNAGLPISNLKVFLTRSGQSYSACSITNSNGSITGIIPANEILALNVVDYCGNIIYTSTIGPFNTGSSNNLPAINLSPSLGTVTISGILKTCTNTNVTSGIVKLKNLNTTNYFSNILQTVTNGNFSFVTNICGTTQQFELIGEDYTNLQTTNPITFTATAPTTNVGVVNTCSTVNEFITYQIDSNPINYLLSGINTSVNPTGASGGLYIGSSQNFPNFSFSSSITTIGTYTTANCTVALSTTPTTNDIDIYSGLSNNVQFVVSQIGPIGGYIDLTFNGTYTDSFGTHTVSGTVHVLRDN